MLAFYFGGVIIISSYFFFGHAFTTELEFPPSNTTREGKLFSFFSSTRDNDDPDVCTSGTNIGTCIKSSRCKSKGGTTLSGGDCSRGLACCQITVNCTSRSDSRDRCIIRNSGTVIRQESGLTDYRRTYQYRKPKGACQLRLDFDEFMLAPPENNGNCREETFTIKGLTICGLNKGQHAYFDFGESSTINADIRIRRPESIYSIRNTFIPCNSDKRAPEGCLQYFDAPEGTVRSFNYDLNELNNMQTNNLDYTVCVKPREGNNKIQWDSCRNQTNPFFLSGAGFGVMGLEGIRCKKDWVQIYGENRFCGKGIRPVISTVKPFMMNVHFDEAEGFTAVFPTDPTQCDGITIEDPYADGRFMGGFDEGMCTWNFIPNDPTNTDPNEQPDSMNTGFCLDFAQMI